MTVLGDATGMRRPPPAAGYVIGAPRKAFGGHVSTRRPGSVAREIAMNAIIHSAGCP